MKIVKDTISIDELTQMSKKMFGELVKAVIDIEKEIMVVDAEMHADQEYMLLESGSLQENIWGINLYPQHINTEKFIEFDSMINLRPSWGNRSRGIDDPRIQEKIKKLVNKLVSQ